MSGKSGKQNCYAVIAAKRRGGKHCALVLRKEEFQVLLQHRCPIYQQQRCRSLGEAAAATDKLSAKDGSNPPRVSLEAFLQENLSRGVVIGAETVLCFYDSEFGMYNYGELQGDVVSMGAVVLPPKSAAGQEPDSKAAQRAEAEAGTVETQNTQNTEPENTEPEMLQKENALPLRWFETQMRRSWLSAFRCLRICPRRRFLRRRTFQKCTRLFAVLWRHTASK